MRSIALAHVTCNGPSDVHACNVYHTCGTRASAMPGLKAELTSISVVPALRLSSLHSAPFLSHRALTHSTAPAPQLARSTSQPSGACPALHRALGSALRRALGFPRHRYILLPRHPQQLGAGRARPLLLTGHDVEATQAESSVGMGPVGCASGISGGEHQARERDAPMGVSGIKPVNAMRLWG